jgi:dihydroxy-acid dehydratase
MTMGTASTMACLAEAMGIALPTNAAIPAVDARRVGLAQLSGRRIVKMVEEDLRISHILTREAFVNAIQTSAAVAGSPNAVLHLLALAGRLGVELTLKDWDELGRGVPCLVNLQPAGKHLMEDFYYAGGLPAVLRRLGEAGHLEKDAPNVNGRTLWENVADAPNWNEDVIRPIHRPVMEQGGIAVLYGNLAPLGAIIRPSTASEALLSHRGRALVFESIEDFHARIDDESLEVDADSVLVLKNCGPRAYPGMPEVGNMQLPPKLLRQGIRDMVRISDARMSGTAYGTVVLHTAPEAAAGGTLALVETGDVIALDVERRSLTLEVDEAVLAERRRRWTPPPLPERGYARLYVEHVQQADQGVDFDFLKGCGGAEVERESH